jgi:uncharacterized phage protein gp47/JayE
MAISTQTFTQFVSNAVAAIQSASRVLVDLTVGSILRAVVQAASGMALWLQGEILQLAALTRFGSSSGADADSWGADFGFPRLPAKFTLPGPVTFSRFTPTNQASVQAAANSGTDANGNTIWTGGVIVQTADGSQQYRVIPDTTQPTFNAAPNAYVIPAGTASASVTVQSVNATAAANVSAGSITLLSQSIPFVDTVSNPANITGGADPETDTAYKARFPQFIASLSRATKAAISFAVQSVVGTSGSFTLTENQSFAGVAQPGFFFVIADDGSGNPPASFLASVTNAVDAVRGETITFGVFAPGRLSANVTMAITTATGFVHATVVAAVTAALQKTINALAIGASLPYNLLSGIAFGVAGVTNVAVGFTLNGGTVDLAATPQQIIKAGVLTVT